MITKLCVICSKEFRALGKAKCCSVACTKIRNFQMKTARRRKAGVQPRIKKDKPAKIPKIKVPKPIKIKIPKPVKIKVPRIKKPKPIKIEKIKPEPRIVKENPLNYADKIKKIAIRSHSPLKSYGPKTKPKIKLCKRCGTQIQDKSWYCNQCLIFFSEQRKINELKENTVICKYCNKSFVRLKGKTSKFCNRECSKKYHDEKYHRKMDELRLQKIALIDSRNSWEDCDDPETEPPDDEPYTTILNIDGTITKVKQTKSPEYTTFKSKLYRGPFAVTDTPKGSIIGPIKKREELTPVFSSSRG